jgi:hypothetical protein
MVPVAVALVLPLEARAALAALVAQARLAMPVAVTQLQAVAQAAVVAEIPRQIAAEMALLVLLSSAM